MNNLRNKLRQLTVLSGCKNAHFNPDKTPDKPLDLFLEWLEFAINSGVSEPHAMVLSTLDEIGNPDARTLILKDVDSNGWYFAISNNSPKGKGIKLNKNVALTFYWKTLARQIRIKGPAIAMDDEVNKKDFLSRSISARAMAMIGKQSHVLEHTDDLTVHHKQQLNNLKQHPELVLEHWKVYCVAANQIEFWQGDEGRNHIRLCYKKTENDKFTKKRLWP